MIRRWRDRVLLETPALLPLVCFFAALLAGFGLALGLVRPAGAQTYPQDVVGHLAAQCATLDADGNPQLCSPSNPLPISGTGTAISTGANWFIAQVPTFAPFVTNGPTPALFLDDVNIAAWQFSAGTFLGFRSADGGRSWRQVSSSTPALSNGLGSGVARAPNGNLIFSGGNLGTLGLFVSADGGVTITPSTCVGCAVLQAAPATIVVNGSTVLAAAGSGAGVRAAVCRSTNSAANITCTQPAGFTASGMVVTAQGLAAPALNTWLLAANDDGTGRLLIYRSTDDGITWSLVFNPVGAGSTNASSVQCFSSSICVATGGTSATAVSRSTDGGATWTQVLSSLPSGSPDAFAVYTETIAVLVTWPGGTSDPAYYRTQDAGVTWNPIAPPAGTINANTCPQNSGAVSGFSSLITRGSRALFIPNLIASAPAVGTCAYYSTSPTAGIVLLGANGQPVNIDPSGAVQIGQGLPTTPLTVAPVQGPTLFNSDTTGAANTAVVVTIAAVIGQRAHLYNVEATCSGGTSTLTITDGGTQIWHALTGEVGNLTMFRKPFVPVGLTSSTNSALVITLAACGAGNTGTLIAHADRY